MGTEIRIFSTKEELTTVIRKELQMLFRENGLDTRVLNEGKNDNSDPSHKERLSQLEAANLIGVSLPTLYKLIRQGKFKQYSLGRKKYLLKSEIIDVLKNQ
ncbi:helix-turn-helix domain-containing protein [Marinilabilia salmonicolor]|uniref:helix-turn-helix domain-containing protein n=1 Tax=Marinilabilia salmonicolor TaxID=989 RepID=UPI00029AC6A9|nr:helix-turn-helix domain-containing protein [Marinilabilia salmonicolor]